MKEENPSYSPYFNEEIKGVIIGENNIIYNYFYYGQTSQVTPSELTDNVDQPLPCPYRGLYHFGPDDAEFFFGREVFIKQLLKATETRNFISILGASGSGKSSVVFAGLVPQLQAKGHWKFTYFRPGNDPFLGLASSLVSLSTPELDEVDRLSQSQKLAHYLQQEEISLAQIFTQMQKRYPRERILVIADRFEELYTLCPDESIRRRFLDVLLAGFPPFSSQFSSDPLFVTNLRADFLGNALSYRPFADLLQNADIKLGAMNREELSEVIEKPAEKLGVKFADGLVQRILDTIENQPGNLPLLEFALTELWKRQNYKLLTHQAYEEIGEVKGTLTTYADQKYGQLSPIQQEQVRRIFVQLVRPGEGTEDTKRLATKTELGEENWSLVKRLADDRLVVTSRNVANQETVELVHEALIKNWGELQKWMNRDREFRSWQERLRGAMRQWQEAKQEEGALLRGISLTIAESWLQKRSEELGSGEQEFIKKSVILRERQKQQNKRLRQWIAFGASAGFIVALSLSGFAGWLWNQISIQNEKIQLEQVKEINKNGKELDALLQSLKLGIGVSKRKAQPSVQLLGALRKAVLQTKEYNRLEQHKNPVLSVSFSPNGQFLASGSDDKTIKLWDVKTGKVIHTLKGHTSVVWSVSFSPKSKTLASASGLEDKTIKLWDVKTGKLIKTLKGHTNAVLSVSFSPDGKMLASGSADNTIKLWDVKTGKESHTLTDHTGEVLSVSFSPDGKMLASGSADNTIKLWDVNTGKVTLTLTGHNHRVNSVSFSPDGQKLASGSDDNTVKLWDIQSKKQQPQYTFRGYRDGVWSVSFSPDSKTLASGSADNTIKLWDVNTYKKIDSLKSHSRGVRSVSFSRDRKMLASGSDDNTIKLWKLTPQGIRVFKNHTGAVLSVNFSRDRKMLASGSADNTIQISDVKTGKKLPPLIGHSGTVLSVSFSPDGQFLASGSADKTIKLWNVKTGKLIRPFNGHTGEVLSVSFSRDMLASGSADKTIKLWNVKTGKLIHPFKGHRHKVLSVSFSPDGKFLASGSDDNTIKFWDVNNRGKKPRTLTGHSGAVSSVSFDLPDSKMLASGAYDNTINLWDINTGEMIRRLENKNQVLSVSFSPDGKFLASGSADKTIKFWDISTGKEIFTLGEHQDKVNSVSFSPDGKFLASGSDDKTVILWELLDFDHVLIRGCDHVRAYLHNPSANLSAPDRHLCDGIGKKKN